VPWPIFAGRERLDFGVDDFHNGRFDGRARFCFAEKIQHHPGGVDGRERVDDVQAGVFRRAAAHRFEHARAFGVDVAAGGNTQTALNHRRQVGDDVAEQVVGDDHVEPLGVFHEPHDRGVHVGVIAFHRRILRADFVEGAFP